MSEIEAQRHEQNVAAGLKGALNNPRVSDEAKERSAEKLEEMGYVVEPSEHDKRLEHAEEVHQNRVLGGYKATLKNPNVSEEAKEHARKELHAAGEKYEE